MKGLQANLRSQLAQSVEAVYMKGTVHPHLVRTLHVYQVLSHHSTAFTGTSYSRPDDGLELWIIQELCNMGDLAAFSKVSINYGLAQVALALTLTMDDVLLQCLSF
jgi:hypothetical protein